MSTLSLAKEFKALIAVGLPIVISQLAQTAMGFVDAAMAGHHSTTSLAAIAIGSGFWLPLFLALSGILMAVTPLTAQAFGAQDQKQIRRHFQQGVYLALLLGFLVICFIEPISRLVYLLDAEADVSLQAQEYLLAVGWGLPAVIFYQALRSFNDGMHNTRPQMYISLFALLANIPLNYLLIYGHWGLPELGPKGCGIATAIVMWLEAILMTLFCLRHKPYQPLNLWRGFSAIDWQQQKALLALGVPIGLSIFTEVSMFSMISLFLAQLGNAVVAAHQVAMSFSGMIFMLPLSLSMAITLRAGFYLGAGQQTNANRSGLIGMSTSLAVAFCSCFIMLNFPSLITAIYSKEAEVQTLAASLLMLAAIYQFSDAIQVSAAGTLRAYKDTQIPFLIMLVAYWGVGLPLGYQLAFSTDLNPQAFGVKGFWWGLIAGLSFAAVCLSSRWYWVSKHYKA